MSTCDDELTSTLRTLLSYLNKKRSVPGHWFPQVTLVYADENVVCVLTDGLPDDPIAGFKKFGRSQDKTKPLQAAVVIAESVDDELLVSVTDSTLACAMARVHCSEGVWELKERYDSEALRPVDTTRLPSLAVFRGFTA